jgi:hypothetical protein
LLCVGVVRAGRFASFYGSIISLCFVSKAFLEDNNNKLHFPPTLQLE